MSRKTKVITATHGRDAGKRFTLTEMDAFSCEEWARDAVSAVYKYATSADNGVLAFISEGIRSVFTEPQVEEIKLPADGSLTADHPVIQNARKERLEAAHAEKEEALNSSPTQMAAILGIRLFFQLPAAQQRITLRPLLQCYTFDALGRDFPIIEENNGVWTITKAAREYIEEPQTVGMLEAEAFKMHTDFFAPAVRLICQQLAQAALVKEPKDSGHR